MSTLLEILRILAPLLIGGGIGSIVGLRWKTRSEKFKSEQEKYKVDQQHAVSEQAELTADNMELKNTADIIRLYREALTDLNQYKTDLNENYQSQINNLQQSIQKLQEQIMRYETELHNKDRMITELSDNQRRLNKTVEQLQGEIQTRCNQCKYKDTCQRYLDDHAK